MSSVYRISENVVFRNTRPDLIMAFDKANGVMYELNDTATSVLKLIDGVRDVDAVVAALADEYNGDRDQIRADVEQVLARFGEVAVVVPV